MRIKVRVEEIAIGALVGASIGAAVGAVLVIVSGSPLPWPIVHGDVPALLPRLLHAGVMVLTLVGAATGAWKTAHQDDEQHLRGVRYYEDPNEAAEALQAKESARMSPDQRAGKIHGAVIGGVELARQTEVSHGLIVAQPNSGKSTILLDLLDQARARGDRVLIHDPKSEVIETHFRDDDSVVVLGPWDARAAIWSPSDIDSPALADEFAAALCGVAGAGRNRYFHQGAATLMSGLIKSYMRGDQAWSWANLMQCLEGDPVALAQRAVQGDATVRQLLPGAFSPRGQLSNAENNVISTLSSSARLLQQLSAIDRARPDALRFAFKRWLLGEDHTQVTLVILNSSAEYPQACAALWGAMLSTAAATISARMPNVSPDDGGAVWLLMDELPQMGAEAIEKIQVVAEVGRSRGARVWAVLQSEAQLAAKLGVEAASSVLAMAGLCVYLKCSDTDAERISKRFGDREIQRIESTGSQGAVPGKTSRHERLPAILPSALTTLMPDTAAGGVWLILGRGALLGRLLHRFGPRRAAIAQATRQALDWSNGTLPQPRLKPPESEARVNMGDDGLRQLLDDVHSPFGPEQPDGIDWEK